MYDCEADNDDELTFSEGEVSERRTGEAGLSLAVGPCCCDGRQLWEGMACRRPSLPPPADSLPRAGTLAKTPILVQAKTEKQLCVVWWIFCCSDNYAANLKEGFLH